MFMYKIIKKLFIVYKIQKVFSLINNKIDVCNNNNDNDNKKQETIDIGIIIIVKLLTKFNNEYNLIHV